MNECTDKKVGVMLHHCELGLLEEQERLMFEQHLLECDFCFSELQAMQAAADLMKSDDAIRELAHSAGKSAELSETSPERGKIFDIRRFKPRYWPALVAAAAVLIFLVLKDWQIDIRPSQEVIAYENRLAIMNFENMGDKSDSTRIGEMIANLLIADLAESHYLQIIPAQRIHDVLRQKGKADEKVITRELASEVAVQTHARWLLLGDIMQIEPNLIVAVQLIDAQSGMTTASKRIEGASGGDIFPLVDSITVFVRQNMALPSGAQKEVDRSVSEVTTSSREAYRCYLEALDYYDKFYGLDAIAGFRKALQYDSTFAMVYYYLSELEDSAYIDRAIKYSDNINWREKGYIAARYAFQEKDYPGAIEQLQQILERDPEDKIALRDLAWVNFTIGDYDSSIAYYRRLLEVDPLDKSTYNKLAYAYSENGNYDSSLWAINKYIELAPEEANPYDTRGDMYATAGKLQEAIASYQEALKIKPDFYTSMAKL
ncbi:MAG: tetratricopeptide repeat protein, partial [Candidatus Zixiibacteriota bacterium]